MTEHERQETKPFSGVNWEQDKTDSAYAAQWIRAAHESLNRRIKEYSELGNHESALELNDLHRATLDMLESGVESGENGFITLLSKLEQDSTSDQELESPGYLPRHGMQLDEFALLARRAQAHNGHNTQE